MGESAHQIPTVCGPYEALSDDRIALVIDLKASAVHEPGPGAFDDPAFGQRFELAGVDAVHHFDTDVMVAAVLDEGALEAGVAPELGEACGAVAGTVGDGDPTASMEAIAKEAGVPPGSQKTWCLCLATSTA